MAYTTVADLSVFVLRVNMAFRFRFPESKVTPVVLLHRCYEKTFRLRLRTFLHSNLVDPASSHMLVSKIKPCMSQYKSLYGETANGSLKQL